VASDLVFKWLWESSCQNKHKIFFWLILKDRIKYMRIAEKKEYGASNYNRVLCDVNVEETAYQLFTSCSFASACWGLINLQTRTNLSPLQNLEFIILICWVI